VSRIVPLDAVRAAPDPEARTVLTLWRYVQLGSWPLVFDQFHPRVVDAVGEADLIGALAIQQNNIRALSPHVVDVQDTERGSLVTVEAPEGRPTVTASFLVRPFRGRYVVVHDTLLGESLGWYVQNRTQARIDPEADEPSERVRQAGREEVQSYARLFGRAGNDDRASDEGAGSYPGP
jgi:hypothetical protein